MNLELNTNVTKFDLERIVDDFVFLCILSGNDFLPGLPSLDANDFLLDRLLSAYKHLLQERSGYLTASADIDIGNFKLLMALLTQLEFDIFSQHFPSLSLKLSPPSNTNTTNTLNTLNTLNNNNNNNTSSLLKTINTLNNNNITQQQVQQKEQENEKIEENTKSKVKIGTGKMSIVSAGPRHQMTMHRAVRDIFENVETIEEGIEIWKERHRKEKLNVKEGEDEVVKEYYFGLKWVLSYYYCGMPSWSWQYGYHYAPLSSDFEMLNKKEAIVFQLDKPSSPFVHLMSVLPRTSFRLVPGILQPLVLDPESSLAPFYPDDCKIDMEGLSFFFTI